MRWALLTAASLPFLGCVAYPAAERNPAAVQQVDKCWKMSRRGQTAEATSCFIALTTSKDAYLRAEGQWGVKNYTGANDQFKEAVKQHAQDPHVKVRWGRLFLERFNKEEASNLFEEALGLDKDDPEAMLGQAWVASEGFDKMAVELAGKALKQQEKYPEAHELLAKLALEDSNPKKAREEADLAIAQDAESLDAMAIHLTIDLLEDQPESAWGKKILAINPRYGRAWSMAAESFIHNRRYEEGIALYKKAIELDPGYLEAYSELGVNLMRLAREDEARQALEHAYQNGYRNAATVNSLTLIDSYKNFITYKHDRYTLRLHKKEAELLRPYMEEQMEKILASYDQKYGFRLKEHVQVEVYPDHADFAVRAIGIPGLGALGVTFGSIVAMDSPSGRPPGSFHWASTLWHEMSHVYTLTATKHRTPRWFTEGMAVYEETEASPDWGDRVDPLVLGAIKGKKLLPVAELERGFVRPSYNGQVIVSYFQAGRICNYIAEKWGPAKLVQMMKEFAGPVPTDAVIKKVLGLDAAEFDKQFLAWIDGHFKPLADGLDDWRKKLVTVSKAAKDKDWLVVLAEGPSLRKQYPDFVESGSVYELLAQAYEAKGDKKLAKAELKLYSDAGGRTPETLKKLAALQSEAGEKKEAAITLDRINLISPVLDEETHTRLATLWLEQGNYPGAVREYRAVVASKPADPAQARYNLAKSLDAAGRLDEAADEVLAALEAAPGFRPAQKLLLELTAKQEAAPTRKK
ncbi:MAG: tetratricopeptide repeat protein [Bryobacteraceae bacterium]|nr:tetratricopeptide repeat protein [Bryobacteraceae bacterium]